MGKEDYYLNLLERRKEVLRYVLQNWHSRLKYNNKEGVELEILP